MKTPADALDEPPNWHEQAGAASTEGTWAVPIHRSRQRASEAAREVPDGWFWRALSVCS